MGHPRSTILTVQDHQNQSPGRKPVASATEARRTCWRCGQGFDAEEGYTDPHGNFGCEACTAELGSAGEYD